MNLSQTELAQLTGISEDLFTHTNSWEPLLERTTLKTCNIYSVSYLLDEDETDTQIQIDNDMFIMEAREKFGSKGQRNSDVLGRVNSLFAGGVWTKKQRYILQAVMAVYMIQENAREKFTPKNTESIKIKNKLLILTQTFVFCVRLGGDTSRAPKHIIDTVDKLVKKYHTSDPYELCKLLGIKIHYYDLEKLKGFFFYQSRQKNIVIDSNVNEFLTYSGCYELGHAILHTKIAMMKVFKWKFWMVVLRKK